MTVSLLPFVETASATQSNTSIPKISNAPRNAVQLGGGGFEYYAPSTGHGTPSSGPWTFIEGGGIAHETSGMMSRNNTTNMEGDYAAYLQSRRAAIETTHSVSTDGTYCIRFKAAPRVRSSFTHDPRLELFIDGTLIAMEAPDPAINDFLEYRTIPFKLTGGSNITIRIAKLRGTPSGDTHTALLDDVRLEKIHEWADPTTWIPAGVPTDSDYVIIDQSHTVTIEGDQSAFGVNVLGELLVTDADSSLNSSFVRVAGDEAQFEVGRELFPFQSTFTLELSEKATPSVLLPSGETLPEMFNAGEKFLLAELGGRLDFHGTPKTAWTHLTETLSAGEAFLQVASTTSGWNDGDDLVIAGSTLQRETRDGTHPDFPEYTDFAERVGISWMALGGSSLPTLIALDGAVTYGHVGGDDDDDDDDNDAVTDLSDSNQTPPETPQSIDQSAEVGNLTRNVRIIGGGLPDQLSEGSGIGGHVMMRRSSGGTSGGTDEHPAGTGRFSNTEFYHLGQKGQMGRYPIHFHMILTAGDQCFVRSCAIHETYNRAITIHGTDSVHLQDNVAYNNLGHAVFLEDGSEQFNVIQRNLVLSTIRPLEEDATIPSDYSGDDYKDRSPASFWISNPHNVFEDNVAAGTQGSGYWFIFPRELQGLSAGIASLTDRTVPIRQSFMRDEDGQPRFGGNTAHSCQIGIDLNDTYADSTLGDSQEMVDDVGYKRNMGWLPSLPVDDNDPNGDRTPIIETIPDFTAHTCNNAVYTSTGGNQVSFRRLLVADCNVATIFASYTEVVDSTIAMRAATYTDSTENYGKAAFRVYDGSARYVNTVVHGFDIDDTFLFGYKVAAVAHPNESLDQMYFVDTPRLSLRAITEFKDPKPSRTTTNAGHSHTYENCIVPEVIPEPIPLHNAHHPLAATKWGKTIFDKGGDITLSESYSLVRNFPLLETPNWIAYAPGNGEWMISSRRFAQVRIEYVDRTLTSEMDLYLNRIFPDADPSIEQVTFEHVYTARQHKQMTVIVNETGILPGDPEAVEYMIDHIAEDFLVEQDEEDRKFTITQDDCLVGDAGWYWLKDFRDKPSGSIEATDGHGVALLEYTDIQEAQDSTDPCLFFDLSTGEVALRIVTRAQPPATNTLGSLPAGSYTRRSSGWGGSVNMEDSTWRSERITLTWD